MKKLIIMSMVAMFAAACGASAEDACEHVNDICADTEGYSDMDCSEAQKDYDELKDDEKEKSDEAIDCLMDVEECTMSDLGACMEKAGGDSEE